MYNQFRNIERISTWTRPECAPDSLHLVSCAGQYTESEFSEFLLQLARILENQPNPVLALAIPNHILGLLYKGENMFELIDTNVDKIAPSGPMTLKQCTHFLFNYAFKHDLLNKKLLIRTTAFATNPDGLPDLSFEHQKKYTQLHESPTKMTLLEMAVQDDDLTLWSQLNLQDIPVEKMEVRAQNALLKTMCVKGYELMVRLLLHHGVSAYHTQFEQEGLLAAIENPKIMALLLQQGVSPNSRHSKGGSPLQSAVAKNKPELAKLLLSHGTSIHYATDTLHVAAAQGHQEMVRLLVTHFPQLARAKDENQLRPLDYAVIYGHHELIMELLPHTPMQPIGFYCLCEHLETGDKDLKSASSLKHFLTTSPSVSKRLDRSVLFLAAWDEGMPSTKKLRPPPKCSSFLKPTPPNLNSNPENWMF